MNRPSVRVIIILLVVCTAAVLLISTTIADVFSNKVVRITFRAVSAGTSLDIARVYQSSEGVDSSPQPIPKILHHVYLDGLDSLQQAENTVGAKPGERFPGYNSTWRHSCHIVHNNWQYMFWNNSQAENLIRTAYPWFLATFLSYDNYVQKGNTCWIFLPQLHALRTGWACCIHHAWLQCSNAQNTDCTTELWQLCRRRLAPFFDACNWRSVPRH